MKKNLLLLFMFLLTIGGFYSCTDEAKDPPTLNVTEVAGATYTAGSVVTYEIIAASNTDLTYFEANPNVVGGAGTGVIVTVPADALTYDNLGGYDFDNNLSNVTFTYAYVVPSTGIANGTVIDIEFYLEDKDADNSVTKSFTITSGAGNISRFTAVLMGAQSSTTGSFLDANTGTVYVQATANTNQSLIDVVYYYGNTNLATLCAPNDETVGGGGTNFSLCEGWTTKNATTFGPSSVTSAEFDAMTDDSVLSEISGLSATKSTSLDVSNVIAFMTADGKKGLIKVSALEAVNTGTITINVIIQE